MSKEKEVNIIPLDEDKMPKVTICEDGSLIFEPFTEEQVAYAESMIPKDHKGGK